MPKKPVLVQFTDELIQDLDQMGARQHRSRSAIVREAVQRYITRESEEYKDQLLIEAYGRIPDASDSWAEAAARDLVEEEPW